MYFYNSELGYTVVGAWGLRKLISTYSGPIVRIRDTVGNAEQDVYANTDGELNSYTVSGNAAIVKVYDQSGNGADLGQTSTGLQPLLVLNATGNGKPVARFDGSDDYLRDATASTTRPYLVAAPVHISMSAPRTPREQWGKVWCIPHSDGSNSTPFSRSVFETDSASAISWEAQIRQDSVQRTINPTYGFNNRKGFNAHATIDYLGRFLQAGAPATTFAADTSVTYPNNTRMYIGANGQGTENNGMDWVEHVVYSTTSPVEADVQALVDKIAYERLYGPNRFFKMVVTGTFSPSQYDGGCAAMELRDTVGGSDVTDQYTPMIANKRYNSTESWEKIFDDNDSTYYSSGSSPSSTTPILYFTKETNNKLAELMYKARGDSFYAYTFKKYHIYRFTQTGWEDSAGGEIDNTSAGNSAAQVYTNALTWTDPTITQTFTFDYTIPQYTVTQTFTFDYSIVQPTMTVTYDFDYAVNGQIDFTFGYGIELVRTFTFNYKIQEQQDDLLGYKHIDPSNTSVVKRAFQTEASGTSLDTGFMGDPGILTIPEAVVLDPAPAAIHDTFYGDYYNRIWVSPEDIRLSNPKIGFEYEFYVWNAYDRPNSLINYVPTDVDGTTFVELDDLPIEFGPVEFKTLHFTIDDDAPSQIEGNMFFEFEMGGDGFDLFALVLGVLKTLPNEPFNEIWSWYSIMEISRNGTEQRQALRDQPRTQAGYEVMILDDDDRRLAYQQLFSFATRSVLVPFFQYTTQLEADVEEGDTRLYFDLSRSDIRAGEYLILFHPQTYQFQLVQVDSLNADGVNILTPITFDAGMDEWEIVPGRSMRLPNKSQLGMGALDGTLAFKGESTVWRELIRPSGEVTLPEYDDYPVLPYKPIAQNEVDETFDSDVEVIDNDAAPPEVRSTFTNPFIESTKQYLIDRDVEMDWWRTFFDYTKGMLRPFLIPTWRDDLPLAEQPELGDNELVTTNTDYADYFAYETYKWVQIQSDAGVIYRKVEGVNRDLLGLRLSLDDAIGMTEGSNEGLVISFLNLTRLNSDEVKLEHYINHTIIEINTRTVNQ